MPESKKESLATMLEAEALFALKLRPDLQPILASDGAPLQWTILKDIQSRMPIQARERTVELIDFVHVSEHLQEAANAIHGSGTPEANVCRATWSEILKAHSSGAEKVLASLRHQRGICNQKTYVKRSTR